MTEATVIIAAWNAEATLERSLASALGQEGVDLEAIVVDDRSTDGTLAAARALAAAEPRLKVIALESNLGPAGARNAALAAARGEWVAVLDADDGMDRRRLAELIATGRTEGADIVLDNLLVASGEDDPGAPYLTGPDFAAPAWWTLRRFVEGNLMEGAAPGLGYLKPVIRRRFLEERGLRYDESLRNGEDYRLVAEALARGARVRFTPQALYRYTRRPRSLSHRLDPGHADALLRSETGFLARHGATLDAELRALLERRRAALADFAVAERAMRALRAGRADRALAALMRRPGASPRLLRQLGEALRKRLGAASGG